MNYWSLLLTHQNPQFDYKHTFIYDFSQHIYLYPFIQDLTWSNFGNHWSWLTYRTCHQIIQILNVLIDLFWKFIIVHKTKRHKYIHNYILSIQYEFCGDFHLLLCINELFLSSNDATADINDSKFMYSLYADWPVAKQQYASNACIVGPALPPKQRSSTSL